MAVVAMWKCDRDGSMFSDKKDADAHDRMLELAEAFSELLTQHSSISEQDAEQLGLLLSRNKEHLMAACKGKPEALSEVSAEEAASNVTPLAAKS